MSALGTEFKFNVHIETIDGLHMSEYDFECAFYVYTNRKVVLTKKEMIQVDDDNYIAVINNADANRIGKGHINMEVTAHIPDSDFMDELRTEKAIVCTGVTVI
jgi:hypothetical protein